MRPKLLIIGHARHGKDTVCDILNKEFGFKFTSSSWFCAERVVLPALKSFHSPTRQADLLEANHNLYDEVPTYGTAEECFNDRHNWRDLWYDLISDYNRKWPARLGTEIFEENDVYCGLRSAREFHALRASGVLGATVWVDRSKHLPPEPRSSNTVEPWMADFVIDNNESLDDLHSWVVNLAYSQGWVNA